MKTLLVTLWLIFLSATATATDLRVASQKVQADYEAARTEAREIQKQIMEDKQKLTSEVENLAGQVEQLTSETADLQRQLDELRAAETANAKKQSAAQMDMREYTGVIRETARDLETILSQSLFTAFDAERMRRLAPVLDKDRFPGMDEIAAISDLFFEEMTLSGEVDLRAGTVVDAGGTPIEADILSIGPFSAAYEADGDAGFLRYNEENRQFFALSKAPPLECGAT